MDLREATQKVIDGKGLSCQEMESAMSLILEGKATSSQMAAFLVALRCKGESVEEITGAVTVMRQRMVSFKPAREGVLDTCGTGGDNAETINVSTLVALAAAGAAIPVAKHGNRSVSSQCGSADLLEALGVKINFPVAAAEKMLEDIGITFLFAPLYHPAMRNVAPVRKELGIRTIFNILGPLCNPAGAKHQLIGVFSPAWLRPLAEVLKRFGTRHVLIVHSGDGLDEISLSAPTRVCELKEDRLSEYEISPEQFGFRTVASSELKGGSASRNAAIAQRVLKGEEGIYSDLVLLNAGAAIYAADRADSIEKGIQAAKESLCSGRALEKLKLLQQYSNSGV